MRTINEAIKVAEDLTKALVDLGYDQINVKSNRVMAGIFEVNLSDDEDTLTLTPLMIECCMHYCHYHQYGYFIWLTPHDGRVTLTIR